MRPIRLTLAGLNSFKEEQEIDFSAICDGSVFGIFGSTGSGKSTIIDAITLALYGKVERSQRGLQGIVNKGMNSASVNFEFALGTATGEERYRVERKYVAKDDTVTCRMARLTHVGIGGDAVLADKVTQVDAEVQAILGLTVDDFTRAVVLPQGKFAEFLSLRGTDRREMLERIFNLEEYGEKLMYAVQRELRGADGRLRDLDNLLQGLGEADAAAVKRAEAELADAGKVADLAQAELSKATVALGKAERIVQLEEKLDVAKARLTSLLCSKGRIDELEQSLERISRAEKMRDNVEDVQASQVHLEKAISRHEAAKDALDSLIQAIRQGEAEHRQAEATLELNQPDLLKRMADADRAVVLELRAQQLREGSDKKEKMLERKVSQVDRLKREVIELTEEIQHARDKLAKLQEQVRASRVDPVLRENAGRAERTMQLLQQASSRVQEIESDILAKTFAHDETEAKRVQAEAALSASLELSERTTACMSGLRRQLGIAEKTSLHTSLIDLQVQLEKMKNEASLMEDLRARVDITNQGLESRRLAVAEIAKEMSSLQIKSERLQEALQQCEVSVTELNRSAAVGVLAKDLKPGEACPVCGSAEHPSPAVGEQPFGMAELEAELRELKEEHSSASVRLTTLGERLRLTDGEMTRLGRELEGLTERRNKVAQNLAAVTHSLPAAWTQGVTDIGDLEEQLKRFAADTRSVEEEGELHRAKLSESRQTLALCVSQIEKLANDLDDLKSKLSTASDAESIAGTELDELRRELGQVDVASLVKDIRANDKSYASLTQSGAELESYVQKLRDQAEIKQSDLAASVQQSVSLEIELDSLNKNYQGVLAEIAQLTGGLPAWEFRDTADRALSELRQQFNVKRTALEGLQSKAEVARQESAAAGEDLKQNTARNENLQDRLRQALSGSGFADLSEWQSSMELLTDKAAWQTEVEQHASDVSRYNNEAERLVSELGGESVSAAEWSAISENHVRCVREYEAGIGRRGRAEAVLEDVRRRNLQYEVLKTEKKPLQERKGLLEELSSLLRGNALVEFIATEHLHNIAGVATGWLRHLSRNRYALEVAADGSFLIRDDAEGGMQRPVYTLSGGETFLTSLALALALSSQIQLRGRYPLEFFFLDEGFGTLDPELLDVVMSSLERMQGQSMSIGIISHVPELRERIQRKILVTGAESGGRGSRLRIG